MKTIKTISLSGILLILIIPLAAQNTGTFTDSRDGHVYNWVQIGDQVWMAENLAYLPAVSPPSTESITEQPLYYVYDYEGDSVKTAKAIAHYSTYGVLYNWPAAMAGASSSDSNPSGVQGVCPSGWHLPSDAEWTELTEYLGGKAIAGGKLKEAGTEYWRSPNRGATNETGFTALPGGYRTGFTALPGGFRYYGGNFDMLGDNGYWWSSTELSATDAWIRRMYCYGADVYRILSGKEDSFSVRCVRDD